MRTSTGKTPFSLVNGTEDVLPVEVEISSLRVLMEVELSKAEWCQHRFDQLNLIEEKRMTALCHGQLYQTRMKQAFDKKVRPCEFKEGDLVVKSIKSVQPDPRGKWAPNYEDPYVVKRAFSWGALILTTMDGDELPHPVNFDAVKKYFVLWVSSRMTTSARLLFNGLYPQGMFTSLSTITSYRALPR